jgi:hypothetical protein
MAADIRDEDKDADKALDSATKQMDNNGIITPQELEVVIAESRAEHEL